MRQRNLKGKQEERLPFFSIRLPDKLKQKYPQFQTNLEINAERLSTPFDMYPTLLSFISPSLADTKLTSKEIPAGRSVSLVKQQLSVDRTCAEAYIEPHWCACLDWQPLPLDAAIAQSLVATLVNTLNNYTQSHRADCDLLSLKELVSVLKMKPNDNLVKFRKSSDFDGFVADLSDNLQVRTEHFQIKVHLQPGDSIFEASITKDLATNQFKLNLRDVSRINVYGRQARCIEDNYPHLRKYCHCKHD